MNDDKQFILFNNKPMEITYTKWIVAGAFALGLFVGWCLS